jgi:hypothetical protein
MDHPIHIWKGSSGKEYTYWIYELPANLPARPGNFIFVKAEGAPWHPLYVGQAQDLSVRFDDHHEPIDRAISKATHIHVHSSSANEEERRREEDDLVRGFPQAQHG